MELDEFKSKSPKEMAQIKALRDSAQTSNKKPRVSSVETSVELLVAKGAKTGTLPVGGQNVSFTVAAAATSTLPATASQAKSGTDKESWLSDDYKEARSKSASAQFGSKGHKKRVTLSQVADDDRKPAAKKPAALETAAVSRTISSTSTGTSTLGAPIPKKSGKEGSQKADANPISERERKLSADAEEGVRCHPDLRKWKNRGMKFWAINRRLQDLYTERDTCGATKPSVETEIARLEKYTKEVVNASSQKKNKGAVLDFEAWISAQNGSFHTDINHWLKAASERFAEGFYDSPVSDSDSDESSIGCNMGRDLAKRMATAERTNPNSE